MGLEMNVGGALPRSLGFCVERRVVDVDQIILDLPIDHVEDVRKRDTER